MNLPADFNVIMAWVRRFMRGDSGEIIQYDSERYAQKTTLAGAGGITSLHVDDGVTDVTLGDGDYINLASIDGSIYVSTAVDVNGVSVDITATGLIIAPQNNHIYLATGAITFSAIKAIRVGGTAADINVRKNGVDLLMASDLAVGTSWTDGGVLQNNALVANDYLEAMLVSVTGVVTDVVIQLV